MNSLSNFLEETQNSKFKKMFEQTYKLFPDVYEKIKFDAKVFQCDNGIIKDEWQIQDGDLLGLYSLPIINTENEDQEQI